MSNVARVAGQAANTLSKPLNVEDVFSTYLYTGNSSTQTITNGIDLAGEGGLVWIKARDGGAQWSRLYDTERGGEYSLVSSDTTAQLTGTGPVTFNSDSFVIGSNNTPNVNYLDRSYASWTFRKAPKFFDVVTWSGNSTSNTQIAHNLGSVPGCIIVKCTNDTFNWTVYHRGLNVDGDNAPETDYLVLNSTVAGADYQQIWSDTAPTDTHFTVGGDATVNGTGYTYVAYLFAHNDGDGDFGPTGDQDIIKCGSYTGNGSTDGPEINLGFEPQWLLIKRTDAITNWWMLDAMRGLPVSGNFSYLLAENSQAESSAIATGVALQPNGFKLVQNYGGFNASGGTYIYIAIRRGPMAVPESATDVFDAVASVSGTTTTFETGNPVDLSIFTQLTGSNKFVATRLLQGRRLYTDLTNAEDAQAEHMFDYMDGSLAYGYLSGYFGWHWRRAPNFFDVVAYTGNGVAGHTVSHNLGVAPEMIWVKRRDAAVNWPVYLAPLGATHKMWLNLTNAPTADSTYWNDTTPTSTEFTLGTYSGLNASGGDYIAYLFTSLDGVSKVGSYNGSSSDQTIDCGFSSGARFVLIKKTSSTGNWDVFDVERGIIVGNDPRLELNTTDAETTSVDYLIPHSSGFTLVGDAAVNSNTASYIFYAIA